MLSPISVSHLRFGLSVTVTSQSFRPDSLPLLTQSKLFFFFLLLFNYV